MNLFRVFMLAGLSFVTSASQTSWSDNEACFDLAPRHRGPGDAICDGLLGGGFDVKESKCGITTWNVFGGYTASERDDMHLPWVTKVCSAVVDTSTGLTVTVPPCDEARAQLITETGDEIGVNVAANRSAWLNACRGAEQVELLVVDISPQETDNLWHFIMGLYQLFRVHKSFGLGQFHYQVINELPSHHAHLPHNDFADLHTHIFGPMQSIESGVTCAKSALLAQRMPEVFQASGVLDSVSVWEGGCFRHPWLLEFSTRVRTAYDGSVTTCSNRSQPLVTMIQRSGRTRAVKNLGPLKLALANLPCLVEYVKFEEMAVRQQLHQVGRTDVLMGVHGSGLTLALWLPPHASVMELMPWKSVDTYVPSITAYEPTLGMLSYASGHAYRIVRAVLTDRPANTHLNVEVDVSAVRKGLHATLSGLAACTDEVKEQSDMLWRPQAVGPHSCLESQGLKAISNWQSFAKVWLQRDPIRWAQEEGRAAVLRELRARGFSSPSHARTEL